MIGRSSLMAAALLAGLAHSGGASIYERHPASRSRGPDLTLGGKMMMFGVNRGARGSAAKDKRASAKRRNQRRNKMAHRG